MPAVGTSRCVHAHQVKPRSRTQGFPHSEAVFRAWRMCRQAGVACTPPWEGSISHCSTEHMFTSHSWLHDQQSAGCSR